ncbi:MAG TPA: hypothetical protein VIM11_20320 [Tepidisphaeraceae bacterium]
MDRSVSDPVSAGSDRNSASTQRRRIGKEIAGDDGTNDLVVSSVIRTNELQTWFIAAHHQS